MVPSVLRAGEEWAASLSIPLRGSGPQAEMALVCVKGSGRGLGMDTLLRWEDGAGSVDSVIQLLLYRWGWQLPSCASFTWGLRPGSQG